MFLVQITGIVSVAVGSVLLIMGYITSEAMVSQPQIDHHYNATIWYLMTGIAGIIAGSILMLLESRD
ncbi:hypothetical protein [Thalassospira sp.]|uniref:hypothetical protein n=1 Tax=Thalassospira sp. TaxID=1912094 RepID=UPI003AA9575F